MIAIGADIFLNIRKKALLLLLLTVFWIVMFILSVAITEIRTADTQEVCLQTRLPAFVSEEYGFSFKYARSISLNEPVSYGDEILFHMDITDKQNGLTGFIQVWNIKKPLNEFLDASLEASELDYSSFWSEITELGGEKAYFWDYGIIRNNGDEYLGKEYFTERDSMMYRLSFFTVGKSWEGILVYNIGVLSGSFEFNEAE